MVLIGGGIPLLNQTSCLSFKKFGEVLETVPDKLNLSKQSLELISNKNIDYFFINDSDTYIELVKGVAFIVVCNDSNLANIENFVINTTVKLNKGVFYNFIPISNDCSIDLYSKNFTSNTLELDVPYTCKEIVSNINVNKIYTKFYQEKSPKYMYKGEKHSFWELTFVDRGVLFTDVDDKHFELHQGDLLFYAPHQYHTQYTSDSKSCCYLTVSFDMDFCDCDLLSNKVFSCDKDIYNLITSLIKELELDNVYSQELCICYIKQLILILLKSSSNHHSRSASKINDSIDDDLLQDILCFVDSNIDKPITISTLCDEFNISSSKLHTIFKEHLDTSAKLYINQLKLKKSKELMSETCYTVSEIAFMLGFNSIHYFSNKFKKEFGFSPKEYINSVNKN